MTDAFALLSEERRPWLEVESLKARFREMSSELHPDRLHQASAGEQTAAEKHFAELSAAFNVLREPRDRLSHLLQLESGTPPRDIQRIPPGTMDLFVEVGQTCRDCDVFLTRLSAATSPMLKLQVLRESIEWTERLNALTSRVGKRQEELDQELREMNAVWATAPAIGSADRVGCLPLERLEQIYRSYSYVSRWTEQLRERTLQLTIG